MARSIHDEDLDEDAEHGDLEGLKRSTKVALVAVLLVLGSLGGVLVYFSTGEGDVTGVTLTPPSVSSEILTFAYTVATTRALAAGSATLTVTHDGATELERAIPVNGGGGRIDVKFGDFAVGNGEYLFRLVYKGQQATSNYTLGIPDRTNFIVTAVDAIVANETWINGREGAISFTANFLSDAAMNIFARAPVGSTIDVRVFKNGVQDSNTTRGVEGLTYLHLVLEVGFGPGNYSVELAFHNQWVKSDSPIKTLTDSNQTFIHNKPTACLNPTSYHGNNANNFTITADASCSSDDEPPLVDWHWIFSDVPTPAPVSSAPSALETHQFPSSVTTRTYTCALIVFDRRGVEDRFNFTVTTSAN